MTQMLDYPDLWELMYNGIRHSVANGARVREPTVERLGLQDVFLMRLEHFGPMPADPPE